MRHSLVFKLSMAFLFVSLVGIGLVAIFSRLVTFREFDRLTFEQREETFIADVSAYYQQTGSWRGLAENNRRFQQQQQQPPPAAGEPPPPPSRQFGLIDSMGRIVLAVEPYRAGQAAPPELLNQGTPLEIDGQRVGTVFAVDSTPPRDPLERRYLGRINQAILIATAGAVIIALGLGLFLARTLTRPLRELTGATQAMAGGDLEQTVPVRSGDELGQLAQSFNQMSADLARANRLRRQMTADIAHDLRSPLTVLTGYLEAMQTGDLPPSPDRFQTMYREARHLSRLVDDLRLLSLADAGELRLNRQSIEAAELLRQAAAAYQHQAEQQQIELAVRAGADLSPLKADPERLAQVLSNLLANALRYTPAGGQITLTARSHSGGVLLQVEDTGSGIPPEELSHIFNRFYRLDKSRHQTGGESGLGLAIARAIVEAHGGAISVASQPGRGTRFEIWLPIASA